MSEIIEDPFAKTVAHVDQGLHQLLLEQKSGKDSVARELFFTESFFYRGTEQEILGDARVIQVAIRIEYFHVAFRLVGISVVEFVAYLQNGVLKMAVGFRVEPRRKTETQNIDKQARLLQHFDLFVQIRQRFRSASFENPMAARQA